MHKVTLNKFMAQCEYMKLNVSTKSKSIDNVYGILSHIWHCDVYYIHKVRREELWSPEEVGVNRVFVRMTFYYMHFSDIAPQHNGLIVGLKESIDFIGSKVKWKHGKRKPMQSLHESISPCFKRILGS